MDGPRATGAVEVVRLGDGEAYLNRGAGDRAAAVLEYVKEGKPYREEYGPETLQVDAEKGTRVTRVDVPGVGKCVLKEMSAAAVEGWGRKVAMAFRIAAKRKYRRTFCVAMAARAAGVDAYEPLAYWVRWRGGGRMFFLCEFVEGRPFEDVCREMAYGEEEREAVLEGFRMLGEAAARLNECGIVNSDMIPRNCFLAKGADGKRRLRLVDLDLAYFASGKGRLGFVHRMRALLRRYAGYYPINEECLAAFLGAYTRGDAAEEARCRRALGILERHAKRRAWAGVLLWLAGGGTKRETKK